MTQRIHLVAATVASVTSALEKNHLALAKLVGARVPDSFPPPLLDDDALRWTIGAIQEPGFDDRYGMFWVIAHDITEPTLVGTAGMKGKPKDGCVEIGYSVVPEFQRKGYATAATLELIARAFSDAEVEWVTAETLPDLTPSIGVLEKCGFTFIGDGSEPGVIRYRRGRLVG